MFVKLSFDYHEFKRTSLGRLYRKYKIRRNKRTFTPQFELIRRINLAEKRYYDKTCKPSANFPTMVLGNSERIEFEALREFKSSILSARDAHYDKPR